MKPAMLFLYCILFGLGAQAQNFEQLSLLDSYPKLRKSSTMLSASSLLSSSRLQLDSLNDLDAYGNPAIIPEGFEATRPLNFLDRIYFGGSNDLVGLRPFAIAQQKMPDPMLQSLHTLYVRSSIGIKRYTRLVLHCECLVFVKTMSSKTFLLPQLGLRQRF